MRANLTFWYASCAFALGENMFKFHAVYALATLFVATALSLSSWVAAEDAATPHDVAAALSDKAMLNGAPVEAAGSVKPEWPNGKTLLERAFDLSRGESSYSEMTMAIVRPDWQRELTMRVWTQGDELGLVRVLSPKKDAGNGTLTKDDKMWTYAPRINRVIKLPSSMMSQSWLGSDFSNKDVAKSTDIIDQYVHTVTAKSEHEGHAVFLIESVPLEDSAVVWGKEHIYMRDDFVIIKHEFWDQDDELVQRLEAFDIQDHDGRALATRMRMYKVETPDEYTEMRIEAMQFDQEMPANTFTLSNLRNPRSR